MAEVKWQARRTTDNVIVDVTADIDGLPQGAPTANAIEAGSGTGLQSTTVVLTNAQIKALPTTSVEVVPAAANVIVAPVLFAIRPLWWTNNPSAAAYTNFAIDNTTGFAFTDTVTGNDVSEYLEFATVSNRLLLGFAGPFPAASSSRAAFLLHPLLGEYVSSGYFRQRFGAADVENAISLYGYNTGGAFTGGHANNTISVTTYYISVEV